jgi:hypothetical protein
MRTVDLAKQALTAIATAFVISGTIVDVNAASTLKMTCGGNLERVRHTGANGDTEDYRVRKLKPLQKSLSRSPLFRRLSGSATTVIRYARRRAHR